MRLAKFCIFFLFICPNVFSQILDDSTKAIYGPKSTRYFLEEDVFNNQTINYSIDTSHINFHQKYLTKRIYQSEIQDLGNNGTSSKHIFYEANQNLGIQFGYNAFNFSRLDLNRVRYFNTKSPFSEMIYYQGGRGQDYAKFVHSQNVQKQLNFTVEIENFASTKILGSPQGRDDRLLKNWNVSLQSNFTSKNNKYILLGGFNFFSHYQVEQGGILPSGIDRFDETFSYTNEVVKMKSASNTQKSKNLHLYQQYKIAKGFQVYHVFDAGFIDNDVNTSYFKGFYKYLSVKSQKQNIKDSIGFYAIENKFGIKGRYKGYNYRLHVKARKIGFTSADSSLMNKTELYTGFWTAYYFKDSTNKLIAEGEIGSNADFILKGNLFTKFGFAQFINSNFSPSFVQNYSTLLYSDLKKVADFNQTNITELKIFPSIPFVKNLAFKPFLSLTNIKNNIYFDSLTNVRQFEKNIQLLRIGLQSVVYKKEWVFESNFSFNQSSNSVIIRIPTLFFDLNVSKSYTFAKKLLLQSGIHLNIQSKYFADAYNPQNGQFFIQNYMKIQGYPNLDFFTNMKINRVRLFFHVNNFTNIKNNSTVNILKFFNKGYFTTPSYTALPMSVGFGINWPLFD
jgi:Putative porin